MDPLTFFERLNLWFRDSITVKLISAGFIALALLIPAALTTELIRDRSETQEEAAAEVSERWARTQTITGPVIMVPYETEEEGVRYAYFLPDDLQVSGTITPEARYRGIYEVIVYSSELTISGRFSPPDFSEWSIDPESILWNEAVVATGVSDMRGIEDQIALQWNGQAYDFRPGLEEEAVLQTGMTARAPVQEAGAFQFSVKLRGSDSLYFVPVGKETRIDLASAWDAPSFGGAFLPDTREVSGDGFTAQWHVLDLNRPYAQAWRGTTSGLMESSFGVRLLLSVDHYRKTLRAAAYAIVVIALTFLTFFLSEIYFERRAHPFQYLLVGLALCLFYGLLLALSEHMPFNAAYASATGATVIAVTGYMRSVFGNRSYFFGAILLIVYGFMFLLLQLEELALLIGMIGLFVSLALTMYLTRNIRWFGSD